MIKLSELRAKDQAGLSQLLISKRAELAEAMAQSRSEEVKNVRGLRALKKDIARIKTLVREQMLAESEKD